MNLTLNTSDKDKPQKEISLLQSPIANGVRSYYGMNSLPEWEEFGEIDSLRFVNCCFLW